MTPDITCEKITASPLVLTDTRGNVIYKNEAAHKTCAALLCGDNIFKRIPDLRDMLRRARAEGSLTFMLTPPVSPFGEMIVDLTKETSHGVLRFFFSRGGMPEKICYEDVAREFSSAVGGDVGGAVGDSTARRITALYDALCSSETLFFRSRDMEPRNLKEVLSAFTDSALPRMRSIGHPVTLRLDDTVGGHEQIRCDVYAFCLILSALASAASYAAKGGITVLAGHTGSEAIITVSAELRPGIVITDTASLGPRAQDVIYAEMLAHASGYSLSMNTRSVTGVSELVFTLRAAESYYSSWIKSNAADKFFISCAAEAAARIIGD